MKSTFSLAVAIAFTVMFCMPNLTAKDDPAGRQGMIDKAMFYLGHVGQSEDGSFSSKTGPGVTGLVVAGLLSVDIPADNPVVAKSLKYLESTRHDDGGLYAPKSSHANYETCLAIMAFAKANQNGKYMSCSKGQSDL